MHHPRLAELQPMLTALGLNSTQSSVYLQGLILGPASIIALAQHTGLGRLAVHQASKQLLDMGLMLETRQGKRRLVYSHSIDGLVAMVEERKFTLRQIEQQLEASRDLFSYLKQSSGDHEMTRLYYGIEGVNTAILEMAQDGHPINIIYDAQALHSMVDEKLFHRSYQQRAKKKIPTRLILPEQFRDYRHLERKEDYDVRIKTLPTTQVIQGGIEVWGDKIALHSYDTPTITTTIIQNSQIAHIIGIMYESMRNAAHDYQEKYLLI